MKLKKIYDLQKEMNIEVFVGIHASNSEEVAAEHMMI